MKAQLYFDSQHALAEGPVWHNGRLYWVNITEGRLYRHNPTDDSTTHWDVGSVLGVALPAAKGWWWTAREHDCAWLHEATGKVVPVTAPITPIVPSNLRFNDGCCGPDGHPWVGSAALDGSRETASLYRADTTGALRLALPNITLSNGLGWSPDNTHFYYVDSLAHHLSVFDYDQTSHQITNRRILREFPRDGSVPDGLKIDAEGHIWLAIWGGSVVLHLDGQTGALIDQVDLPVTQVTSCTFGGPDGKTLYITSARTGLDEAELQRQPLAGSIFQVETMTHGLPLTLCALPPPSGG